MKHNKYDLKISVIVTSRFIVALCVPGKEDTTNELCAFLCNTKNMIKTK